MGLCFIGLVEATGVIAEEQESSNHLQRENIVIKRIGAAIKRYYAEYLLLFFLSAAVITAGFPKLFVSRDYYFGGDAAELYFPSWVFLNSSIRNLHFPILNPFWSLGSLPFAPLEFGALYPPLLLLTFLVDASKDLDRAWIALLIHVFMHYLLAAVSFHALLRFRFRLGAFAALFGAIIYIGSGSFIGRFNHFVVLYVLAWLPLLFYFYLRFKETRSIRDGVLVSIVIFLIATSSHPQIIYYALVIFGVFAAIECLCTKPRGPLIAASFLMVAAGALLLAPRAMLLLELSQNMVRTDDSYTIHSLFNSIHPLYYLTLVAPSWFGRHEQGYWGSDYVWGNWDNMIYAGQVSLLVLPLAFYAPQRKVLFYSAGCLSVLIFLMLGKYFEPSAWINRESPFSTQFTLLSKLTIFFHFFLAILAALGLESLSDTYRKDGKLAVFSSIACVVAAILFSVDLDTIGSFQPAERAPPSADSVKFAYTGILTARAAFLATAGVIVFWFLTERKVILYLLIPVFVADIYFLLGDFNPIQESRGIPSRYFSLREADQVSKQDASLHRNFGLYPVNLNMVQGLEDASGYHTIQTKAYHEVASLLNYERGINRKIFDIAGVKYVRTTENIIALPGFQQLQDMLWLNRQSFERAEFIPDCMFSDNQAAALLMMTERKFDPRRVVMLGALPAARQACQEPRKSALPPTPVKTTRVNYEEYEFELSNRESGFLFIGVAQYPGWHATLNGAPAELLPANLAFYAVELPAGRNRVNLSYSSRSFNWGCIVTGIFLCLALCGVFLTKRLRRSSRDGSS